MSYGGLDMEWAIVEEMLRLRKNSDQELLDMLYKYKDNTLKVLIVENELKDRGTLDKYRKEYPELWI